MKKLAYIAGIIATAFAVMMGSKDDNKTAAAAPNPTPTASPSAFPDFMNKRTYGTTVTESRNPAGDRAAGQCARIFSAHSESVVQIENKCAHAISAIFCLGSRSESCNAHRFVTVPTPIPAGATVSVMPMTGINYNMMKLFACNSAYKPTVRSLIIDSPRHPIMNYRCLDR